MSARKLALEALKQLSNSGDRATAIAAPVIEALESELAQAVEPAAWQKTFNDLLEDYAMARVETALWSVLQIQPADGIRLVHPRWNALMAHIDLTDAAPQEPAAPAWMPIETAPKGMFSRLFLVNGFCVQGFRDAADILCAQNDRQPWRKMHGNPTHWMPLPPVPGGAA